MLQEFLLYLEILVFLVGTFVYGFLVRELFRQRAILPGNKAIRALALCLAIWYSGSLIDELASILVPNPGVWAVIGPYVDVVRGLAWVTSYPLLAHTMWSLLDERRRPSFRELVVCYLMLVPFIWIAAEVIGKGETALAVVGREVYQVFVVLVTLSVLLAARFTYIASRSLNRPDIVRFLRWLLGTLLVVEGLVLTGAVGIDIWMEPLWRILVSSSSLVLGFTFLYFVRRYNLMSLSLSNRSLRHFSSIVGLLLLVLLGGWALGIAESDVFRRFLALGILVGTVSGLLYRPLLRWTAVRSPRLARSLGRGISREELDSRTRRFPEALPRGG